MIDLVSREKLRHIFLIGGCDGARGERKLFTDFATRVPEDCLILTWPQVSTVSTSWTSATWRSSAAPGGCRSV
ncbi:hypothetical protein ACNKHS_04870 [Shigella flexneri]